MSTLTRGVFVTWFGLLPGSVQTNAGKGSESGLDRRSTRAAGLVLTPIPCGAELVRRERLWGVGVAVFSSVLNGRLGGTGSRLPVIPSPPAGAAWSVTAAARRGQSR